MRKDSVPGQLSKCLDLLEASNSCEILSGLMKMGIIAIPASTISTTTASVVASAIPRLLLLSRQDVLHTSLDGLGDSVPRSFRTDAPSL